MQSQYNEPPFNLVSHSSAKNIVTKGCWYLILKEIRDQQ